MALNFRPTYLNTQSIDTFIQTALHEDIGDGDHSTLAAVPADAQRQARLIIKDTGMMAGMELASYIFHAVDPTLQVTTLIEDGSMIKYGDIGLTVTGKAQSILQAERLVLNCMQRMSGIATYTHQLVQLISHTKAKLLDTRKTTPNFRLMEKWAVAIGGGLNHRFGLFDMIILKDNHIDYAGGVTQAIQATHQYLKEKGKKLNIVVETRNLKEVEEVLQIGDITRIMLDNMPPDRMREAITLIDGRFPTEASGGITEETIAAVAESGVDYISVGALTHSVKSLDISLKAF
ncbi:carboxylating nicotinate-nucleotide diphosphorylase [Cytophagaceae bacterium DM2B3-1]|uniref:nicotinate-nucleotide diphosphorylase (carboxylating) n=1 Tax=Xanthocytophaga flava TaxID=3048013 RepID=A0ABT7CDE1_9BACT|nr:carboxylating nicotinate-nucleotide diphosphorylase [Xanthocytophaga flavus]MDJ1471652.1 carboxylating nicotinate-nucleotide diphosphorylase [Xanthocytophaga flavus]MDJ1491701.1 carboxylating nicotinate-nucleotide diphosphorylase [Xanthocytophaga flavus]